MNLTDMLEATILRLQKEAELKATQQQLEALQKATAALPEPVKTETASVVTEVDLSGLKKKPAAGAKKTEYPSPEDPGGAMAKLALSFLTAEQEEKAAKSKKEEARGQLIERCRQPYFELNRNVVPASSLSIETDKGEVLVTFKDRYVPLDGQQKLAVQEIIGPDLMSQFFRQQITLEIDNSAIPADKQQKVVDAIRTLATTYGIESAVSFKSAIVPVEGWHEARHRELSPAVNLKLERLFGEKGFCQVSVGRSHGRASK